MKWIQVESSGPLHGSVRIQGSKNSSLALIAAACMASGPVTLTGIPDILDMRVIQDIVTEIGVKMERREDGSIVVDAGGIHNATLDIHKTSAYRASYYFVGALLARTRSVTIGYPGGDNFVSRPIDQHFKVLKAMGAGVDFMEDRYVVKAERLQGASVYFDTITCGATINAMLAAVLAEGRTELRNAAQDPEVVDTANLLNRMGAHITGAGTDFIRIEGVKELGGCTYAVIPDRLIAGAFLMTAGITGGTVTVEDVIPEHLNSCLSKLREIGLPIEVTDSSITAYGGGPLRATRVRTGMYPLFATDLQQPLTAMLLTAPGRSIVSDRIYPERFSHVPQLRRMGAQIDVRSGCAFIRGGRPLQGSHVHASDVRAGTCLIMAGLAAEGTTYISGVEHIERGYEDAIGMFRSLGAKISYMSEQELPELPALLRS
ncbi:UDP-N-acetylglucosamine 1-carboxyvinyltransferase [Gorillibacterium sp. sgz5001074]|uniref:UDP-N-acetylglucosamine 1-carboxyvinyltransferase n=1 Tax=Gorillibacterium sp. sgz5001074 TaxID=3446695 RepID=UPI003F66F582